MSSTISTITSGLVSCGGKAAVALKAVAVSSGHLFTSIFYTPTASAIGGVAAKANALSAPFLGPVAPFVGPALGLGATGALAYAGNRLWHHDQLNENNYLTYTLIKAGAVALAILAGCAAAATVALVAPALPVYASIALGATVVAASIFLPVDMKCTLFGSKKATEPTPSSLPAAATV